MIQFIETQNGLVNFKKVIEKTDEILHLTKGKEGTVIEFENGDILYFVEDYNTITQTLNELHQLSKTFTGFSLKANDFLESLCRKTIEDA